MPLVKICGLTRPDQARETMALGADFIGINFWPQSRRFVRPSDAGWLTDLPETASRVGVFVNPSQDEVEEIAGADLVSIFQLHGDESPAFCTALEELGFKVIKAFQVRDETSLARIADYGVTDILLDAYHPQARGGIGETFPWRLATRFKERYPDRRLWLAGGLNPDNVAEAIREVHPFAVDVANGVENGRPGMKNLIMVEEFIKAAKGRSR
jgi:phosphoribosylanthranilate isomerase